MKITVVGAGFVGLTTALGLCSQGHSTVCVDLEEARLNSLRKGVPPFFEPGMQELLTEQIDSGLFSVSTDLKSAMDGSDVSIICVGTPSTDSGIDLSYVVQAARDIAAFVTKENFHVVTVKSTVVPGTVDEVVRQALEDVTGLKAGIDFGLAMNPEFLREGCAVSDFENPDRIVIGAEDDRSSDIIKKMYTGFDCPIIVTTSRNAEMIKYASNALLATLISYANEITTICENVPGLSEEFVMHGLFEDRRFWSTSDAETGNRLRPDLISYLRGGIGFGGSCFPKDVKALLRFSQNTGHKASLLQSVLDLNEQRSAKVVDRISQVLEGNLAGKTIAVLGLSFKPDTDDIRESPALSIIRSLHQNGSQIVVHDPVVMKEAIVAETGIPVDAPGSIEATLSGVDGAIIATGWQDYKDADWPSLANKMKNPVIFDGRQVIPAEMRGLGFTFLQPGDSALIREY